jgi:hypothetical protein
VLNVIIIQSVRSEFKFRMSTEHNYITFRSYNKGTVFSSENVCVSCSSSNVSRLQSTGHINTART